MVDRTRGRRAVGAADAPISGVSAAARAEERAEHDRRCHELLPSRLSCEDRAPAPGRVRPGVAGGPMAKKRVFEIADLFKIRGVSDPQIAGDGSRVAYVEERIDRDARKYLTT